MGLALRLTRALSAPLPSAANEQTFRITQTGKRQVSDEGVALIRLFEGCHLKAYHDPVGFPTQGIGRLLSRKRYAPLSQFPDIDDEQATVWLREDLDKFSAGVVRLFPTPLNDNEFAALVSFSFNLGLGALQASTLRKMVLRGERGDGVAREFLRWNKASGKVLRGLTRRRAAEAALFVS